MRIHVEDNRLDIASEHREKLFQLGFTTKPEGSGIGLRSSANAAQQLGGALSWHSDGPACGARFTLELPMTPAPYPGAYIPAERRRLARSTRWNYCDYLTDTGHVARQRRVVTATVSLPRSARAIASPELRTAPREV